MSRHGPRRWARIEDVIDHDETSEPDRERVREALGDAGERDTGHSGERIDPSRDREARERLEEPPPAGDRDHGAYAYGFPDDVTHQQGTQALLAALDQAAPADKSNKLGWLRWLEVQD